METPRATDYGIDWSKFDATKQDSVECKCGCEFRSLTKAHIHKGTLVIVSREPCPKCGANDNIRAVRSDWESWTI